MPARVLPWIALAMFLTACAGPGPGVTGNDTGAIIPYAAVDPRTARELAAEHCARFGKLAYTRSVDRRYGGYYSFGCRWNRRLSY